ncbi:MAG TPA: hypothetical protein VFZ99_02485, partial [Terriglobales bacterium]
MTPKRNPPKRGNTTAQWKGIVGKGFSASDFSNYVQTVQLKSWRPMFVVLHNTYIPKLADWHRVPGA